ncbi:16S rRNA (adenine(1518)-N(6)/adenine(1519)-N(6))-dimethyltransferase RsmA [Candidatus Viadribacter manganicus]|uniref:Ribosomal RNA small subunit methyltransferase A n=1 Tax=Candidatus Viadribacter manganicus TaxID=1759059 RepID=A0A1B1ADZ4_9PROT|nr:16S rRNA (adenine(1518)-N(6)/adenine(1519)-N(6))-dimethyltransferase RsmA [Candidatus Viadribacter manganicus]ANP44775.1 16S rRNA methyltransferase [Candidatus Viadribacter manganicus]
MNADELPTLRDELEAHGLWANKGLGQHFLLDLNITRRIARSAGAIAGKPVLEIGPGPGGLTRALLEAGADPLIVIEKDPRFVPMLEPLSEWSGGKLQIVQGDALQVDEAALVDGQRASVVSNLPYNVGTPLLVKWLKAGPWRGDMTLMFQKEVAQRIVAKPGSDAYGRLAVLAQARCEARLEFTVPARAFTPPPKIASAIVRLTDRADPYPHLDALERITAAAFGQRRKMLRAALRSLLPEPEPLLHAADIAPTARAEEIDQAGFRRLADAWLTAKA